MAKWGEGDPRWIVEDRPDAKNVNNWHWTEKNASAWSKDKLEALLVGLVFDGPQGSCEVTDLDKVTGEASANNRKGRLIFFYDWVLRLKWNGATLDQGDRVTGMMEIPNFSEENGSEGTDVMVTTDETSHTSQQLKEMLHQQAPPVIREKLEHYIMSLKNEFSQGMLLPNTGSQSTPRGTSPSGMRQPASGRNRTTVSSAEPSVGYKIHTKKVSLDEVFQTTVEELFDVFTNPEMVQAFTHSATTVNPHRGGQFSMLGGQISGEFTEVQRPNKLVQKWRSKSWPDGHFSTVTIKLVQESDGAKLTLNQTGVPESDYERTLEGWQRHIFESIKNTFGYGARLY